MNTYEEFLKKNDIQKLKAITLGHEEKIYGTDVIINGDPRQYIDVAQNASNLHLVYVDEIGGTEYYESVTEFIRNCNEKVKIANGIIGTANKQEYLQAEEKIQQILSDINPKWSTKQKLAYIHYKMGEIVSYIPDFNFRGKYVNSPEANNSRNIWKSIVDGQSVCNGIVSIQRNILARLGIKTKELSSKTHSFLLTETEDGNIITDPTWDLSSTLYQARPQYFGVTYEELKKVDGVLSNAHKLQNPPENVIGISEQELREIYYSIGLTNEDRTFVFPLFDEVQSINQKEEDTAKDKIDKFFTMFSDKFSQEASHLSETRTIVELCLSELGVQSNLIRTKFVYSKNDIGTENPSLVLHINTEDLKERVRILDLETFGFKEIAISELNENYKLHNLDTTDPFWREFIPKEENETQRQQENEK